VAGATVQSYATTRLGPISISYGDVVVNGVAGAATDQNAGHAIVGSCYARHRDAASVQREDAGAAKQLNNTRTSNRAVCLRVEVNPILHSRWHESCGAAATGGCDVGKAGDIVPVQIQRQARRAKGDAGCSSYRAGYVTNQLAVLHDRQRGSDGTANICGSSAPDAQEERSKKRLKPGNDSQTRHR